MDYDDILNTIGGTGKYQTRMMAVAFFPVLFGAFSSPISNFLVGDHRHRCKIPSLENDTYEVQDAYHSELINSTIPLEADGSYKKCSLLVNLTTESCDEWVFEQRVFTETVTSQVLMATAICLSILAVTIGCLNRGCLQKLSYLRYEPHLQPSDAVQMLHISATFKNSTGRFKLVCSNELGHSHAVMTYFLGQTVTPIVMLPLADIVGRRLIVCLCVTFGFIVNVTMPFSTSAVMFAVLRFFDGVCSSGVYGSAFVIGIELVGVSQRKIAGTVINMIYCSALFLLAFLAYFIRNWRWLQLAVSVPMAVPFVYWLPKILPESVRWLISKGRVQEAKRILQRAAKINGRDLPSDFTIYTNKEATVSIFHILKSLLTNKKLLIFWIIASTDWFAIVLVYYGITLNLGKFGADLYVSFSLSVAAEALGYAAVLLMDMIGHKRLLMTALAATGASCIVSVFPVMFADKSLVWITVTFAMIGKFFVSLCFAMIYVYVSEIFPTVVRALVIGSCILIGKTASLLAPYLYLLADGKLQKGLPLILYGVMFIVVTLLTSVLPDTTKRKLPDHINEASRASDRQMKTVQSIKTDQKEENGVLLQDNI